MMLSQFAACCTTVPDGLGYLILKVMMTMMVMLMRTIMWRIRQILLQSELMLLQVKHTETAVDQWILLRALASLQCGCAGVIGCTSGATSGTSGATCCTSGATCCTSGATSGTSGATCRTSGAASALEALYCRVFVTNLNLIHLNILWSFCNRNHHGSFMNMKMILCDFNGTMLHFYAHKCSSVTSVSLSAGTNS